MFGMRRYEKCKIDSNLPRPSTLILIDKTPHPVAGIAIQEKRIINIIHKSKNCCEIFMRNIPYTKTILETSHRLNNINKKQINHKIHAQQSAV